MGKLQIQIRHVKFLTSYMADDSIIPLVWGMYALILHSDTTARIWANLPKLVNSDDIFKTFGIPIKVCLFSHCK